jgi:hypothetical protein
MRLRRHLRRFLRNESAVVAAEWAIAFPVYFALFLWTMEVAYMMTRTSMLDRSLDMVIRDLRLGRLGTETPTVRFMEERVCSQTTLFPDCLESLTLEFTTVNQTTFAMPNTDLPCVLRTPEIHAGRETQTYNVGTSNDLMVVRACMLVDTIMPFDGPINYRLNAYSAFVNEP